MTFSPVEIATIGVVVPARNEERRLPRCLAAIATAATALRVGEAETPRLRVVVVADRCTDADSAVPVEWLRLQLHHARSGVELALGTVAPDPQELAAGILAAWRLRHLVIDGHPHVHGANLGIRADTYRAAGGFQDVAAHEDVLLGIAVRATGARVISTAAGPVLTSGRTQGRAPLGMATYLRELEGDQLPLEA